MNENVRLGGEAFAVGVKTSPGMAVSAAIVAGIPLEHWVVYLTVALLLVQLGYSLWKWARELRRAKTGA